MSSRVVSYGIMGGGSPWNVDRKPNIGYGHGVLYLCTKWDTV